jgi:hypothetical protein
MLKTTTTTTTTTTTNNNNNNNNNNKFFLFKCKLKNSGANYKMRMNKEEKYIQKYNNNNIKLPYIVRKQRNYHDLCECKAKENLCIRNE